MKTGSADPNKNAVQQIDIAAVIRKKWANKLIPPFLLRLVEKLIHQEEINEILRLYGSLEGSAFMHKLVEHFGLTLEFVGKERLPENGRALFISNHPLGALDGICLVDMLSQVYQREARCIVNDLLLNLQPLQSSFVAVNKYGKQSREMVQRMDEVLHGNDPLITFPAGICSRFIGERIQDLPWQKSFVRQALRSSRPIVPLFFEGKNSNRFYRIERWRTYLGIKFNIGTMLLPDEMFKAKGSHFRVFVGNPIAPDVLKDMGENVEQITAALRLLTYQLPYTSL